MKKNGKKIDRKWRENGIQKGKNEGEKGKQFYSTIVPNGGIVFQKH